MNKLIVILGPTATGKSEVAIALAKKCNGEVISADSAQVYQGLNIGTAKIKEEEKQGVPHHLLDIADETVEYNVGFFQEDAKKIVADIQKRGKIPILCGGSGLYINSVINEGYELGTISSNNSRRKAYMEEEKIHGKGYLYQLLEEKFPLRAKKIHPNDYQRILRGLEMTEDIDEEDNDNPWTSPYDLKVFGLTRDRKILYEGIEARVENMFAQGLIDEVTWALKKGYKRNGNALTALGYKEILLIIDGILGVEEGMELLKKNTRHFAKRQLTWFRRDPRILWYDVDTYHSLEDIAANIFLRLKKDFNIE